MDQNASRQVFVVVSISLVRNDEYLVELVPKKRLERKDRRERWRSHDEYFGDEEDRGSPLLYARMTPPVLVPLSAVEFGDLDPHVGMEVRLRVEPTGV